jgi:hypothetical protein
MLKQTLRLIVLSLAALAIAAPSAFATPAPLDLELLGRTPAGGEATAEIAAFDPKTKRVFATDAENNQLDVFDFSKPAPPLHHSVARHGAFRSISGAPPVESRLGFPRCPHNLSLSFIRFRSRIRFSR